MLLKEDGRTIVAIENSEDYSNSDVGFYTFYHPNGKAEVQYRIVGVHEKGYLVPFLDEKSFYATKQLCDEYISKHQDTLMVVDYDEIINIAGKQNFKGSMEKEKTEQEDVVMKHDSEEKNVIEEKIEKEKIKFVTIDLSKKQIDFNNIKKVSEVNGKKYVRIFAPDHGVVFYPVESLKQNKNNADRVYFSCPEGTELRVYYSKRKDGIPETAPKSEKYESYYKLVKIEDLKAGYEREKQAFIDRKKQERDEKDARFINMMIPTGWGKQFRGKNGEDYVSIAVPIPEDRDKFKYYSFIIPSNRFAASDYKTGYSYFGFPRHRKDSNEDYMVNLKHSEKQEDGTYMDIEKQISSYELKKYVDAAIKIAEEKETNDNVSIDEQENTNKENKEKQYQARSVGHHR